MKLSKVYFVNVVNFGGSITSATANIPSDPGRTGSVPTDIELDDKMRFVKLTKTIRGKVEETFVPISNVSNFSEAEVKVAPAPVQVKK